MKEEQKSSTRKPVGTSGDRVSALHMDEAIPQPSRSDDTLSPSIRQLLLQVKTRRDLRVHRHLKPVEVRMQALARQILTADPRKRPRKVSAN